MSDVVERLKATKHGLYWDLARDAIAEIARLRTLLYEAQQREKDARAKALEEAARIAGSVSEQWIERGSLDLQEALGNVIASIVALQSEER